MVTYQFIRYVPYVTKDNIAQQTELFMKHQDYLKVLSSSASVITEAIFGDAEGGIFVVNGEISKEVIENDPAVQQGMLVAEVKKLWIAKGAFCEK
jgi:secreted PhoX family phosphatase